MVTKYCKNCKLLLEDGEHYTRRYGMIFCGQRCADEYETRSGILFDL